MHGDGQQFAVGVERIGKFDNKRTVFITQTAADKLIININPIIVIGEHFIDNLLHVVRTQARVAQNARHRVIAGNDIVHCWNDEHILAARQFDQRAVARLPPEA
jgi:hypothetical protein